MSPLFLLLDQVVLSYYAPADWDVSLKRVMTVTSLGEQKTKPIQNSVRTLRGQGLSPDMIVCRCKLALEDSTKRKISQFCSVPADQVISVHDVG